MNPNWHPISQSNFSGDSDDNSSPVPAPRLSQSQRPSTTPDAYSSNSNYAQRSQGIQTGNSLFRQFHEKKDKAIQKVVGPQAYFIECDSKPPSSNRSSRPSSSSLRPSSSEKQRPKSAIEIVRKNRMSLTMNNNDVTTTIIDLETDTLPIEKNLQEALKAKRPDYIAKTKNREQDRLARSMVAANKQNAMKGSMLPQSKAKTTTAAFRARSVYDPDGNGKKSRIPMKATSGTTTSASNDQQNGHRSETVTLYSKPRSGSGSSVTCKDVRRSGSASGGQTNAKKLALNRSRAIKAYQ